MTKVSILGGGSWGTALALASVRAGKHTTLWARDADSINDIKKLRENRKHLPGISLGTELQLSSQLDEVGQANIILIASPAQALRSLIEQLKPHLNSESYLVICSKGIEIKTGLLMHEVLDEVIPGHSVSLLSGPTFALDVAKGHPTAATLASKDMNTSRLLSMSLHSKSFRLYSSDDITGVALSGALKNVVAIASGIATSRNYGESTRASLITRGLAEITRLGRLKKAQIETFLGLSGVGDILLSCTSSHSRNMRLGLEVGKYSHFKEMPQQHYLAEGYFTAKAIEKIISQLDIEMPICQAVANILHNNVIIDEAINSLLSRPLKNESYI